MNDFHHHTGIWFPFLAHFGGGSNLPVNDVVSIFRLIFLQNLPILLSFFRTYGLAAYEYIHVSIISNSKAMRYIDTDMAVHIISRWCAKK